VNKNVTMIVEIRFAAHPMVGNNPGDYQMILQSVLDDDEQFFAKLEPEVRPHY
jgi:hypothetical protein